MRRFQTSNRFRLHVGRERRRQDYRSTIFDTFHMFSWATFLSNSLAFPHVVAKATESISAKRLEVGYRLALCSCGNQKIPQTEHTANINRMTFSMSTPCQMCKPQPCSGGFTVHPSNLSCFVAVRPFAHSKIARPQPNTSKP